MSDPTASIIWRPQPGPQKALVDCPVPEIFFGGARGGGKTDGVLGKYALKAEMYGAGFNGAFFRKQLPMLDDAVERSRQIYLPLGAIWREHKKAWRFPNGARLKFRPLERVADAEKYQGQSLTDACVEEAGNYASPDPIDRLNGLLRSAHGVPTQLILTGNPGGPGHLWLKARYVDPAPLGMTILTRDLPGGGAHRYVFIPSKLDNNRLLVEADPHYANRLHLVGSAQLVRAWLEGDWSVIAGAFFPEFSHTRHVVTPTVLPSHWLRFRSMDWGSAKPFSVGWWAVADGEAINAGSDRVIALPRGCLVRYREWYGASSRNVGLKLTAEEVADGIRARESGEAIAYGVLDPSAFARDGGPSIAERMALRRVVFRPADNSRVAGAGAIGGWDALRARLLGEDGHPMMVMFATCTDAIRTLPALQHDPDRPEDVDSTGEDHVPDDIRYACMSRPWVRTARPAGRVEGLARLTMNRLWEAHGQRDAASRGRIV